MVGDREPLRLCLRQPLVALRHRLVEVAALARAEVARDPGFAPAEVVGRRDVGEEVEPVRVPEVNAGLDDPRRIDDEGGLPVRLACLDQARDAGARVHCATSRIAYAGGTPALIFSWSRTMPSISASGRGGQPGT